MLIFYRVVKNLVAEKLDFIMKVTNVSNSTLGKYLSFDPSYISRIRTGKRGLPKHQPFIEPVADFFSRNINEEYQRKLIAEVVCPYRAFPEDSDDIKKLIIDWFNDDSRDVKDVDKSYTDKCEVSISTENGNCQFYYGNKGKRQAIEKFFKDICEDNKPVTVLLYSDEEMDWFCEDEQFKKIWSKSIMKLISIGCRIKIIHSLNRGINDMLEILNNWIPIYLSGAIEPYHYAKLRDGIYHRTLFVAPGHSALISDSVGANTDNTLNILINDEQAVGALKNEFNDYLSLCRPLLNIYNMCYTNAFISKMSTIREINGDAIIYGSTPSIHTMPKNVALQMSKRTNTPKFMTLYEKHKLWFEKKLKKGNMVIEIISLTDTSDCDFYDRYVPMCDIYRIPELKYERREYIEHLENVLSLLSVYPNFKVVISDNIMGDMSLLAMEEYGVVIARETPPTTIFEITEQSLRMAFWEYLIRIADSESDREDNAKLLKKYIEKHRDVGDNNEKY